MNNMKDRRRGHHLKTIYFIKLRLCLEEQNYKDI